MKKRTPIFRKILVPLMLLTMTVISILVFTLFGQGLVKTLNQNEKDVLLSQVEARRNYMEGVMINDWMQLDEAVGEIVAITERYLAEKGLRAADLDDNTRTAAPLLTELTQRIIHLMRTNRVTGAYIIFNGEELGGQAALSNKPGLYIRDPDPASLASEQNEDLFLKISPKEVLSAVPIPTDSEWDICFRFSGENEQFAGILTVPFNAAWRNNGRYTWQDMGRWHIVQDNDRYKEPILTYTVPLILHDGTAVGVLGVDLTFDHLQTLLPYTELGFDGNGAYVLARYDAREDRYFNMFAYGNTKGLALYGPEGLQLDEAHYICSRPLHLYESNTPFSADQWILAGVVGTTYMQSSANDLIVAVAVAICISLLTGVLASMFISYRLQKPIAQIAAEIASTDPRDILQLTPTGFQEVDAMADEIMKLSGDVLESGRKFSRIMEMSSIRMSGFQINRSTGQLFLTEEFFAVFGEKDLRQTGMTLEGFRAAMERYAPFVTETDPEAGEYILCMPIGSISRYIRLCLNETEHHCYGLVEDVTREIQEKQLLQHERDHDPLTNLFNRRAFRSRLAEILSMPPENLGYAALVMIDLDNLKYFNDTFGHEYGDQYIIRAAAAIEREIPVRAICARISGDEFNVFYYGCTSQQELTDHVNRLQNAVNAGTVILPDGTAQNVHASGGVAYYPAHSNSIDTLSKYADYAMYIAKRNHKRSFVTYDPEMFRSQEIQLRHSESLTRMLQYNLVHFALQPIVDARSGEVFAYEALMRPEVDQFFTVLDVLETARRDGKLSQVEELTLFRVMELFDAMVRKGEIPESTCLFVNSIANQCISQEKGELFVERYGKYAGQLVLEVTEEDKIDKEIWALKEHHHRVLGGRVALDDYGTGYNSELMLLLLSPEYIKIDMSIVRDIHRDKDKQQIIGNIVRYAHDRGKAIIAEGVETAAEVRQLLALEVDYMQGYFFGRPHTAPQTIPPEARKVLGL